MRPLVAIVLVLGGLTGALAEGGRPVRIADHPELRALLAPHTSFVPQPKVRAIPAPVWSTHVTMAEMPPPAAAGPEVVRMAPVFVSGDPAVRELRAAVQRQAVRARAQRADRRLGIGVHRLHLGRVSFYVATIFDLPFMIGVGSPPTNEGWGPIGHAAHL